MSALDMYTREDALNDRANDYVGFFLHGLGDTGDCAEAERTYREFQDELVGDGCQECHGYGYTTQYDDYTRDPDTGEFLHSHQEPCGYCQPITIDAAALEAWEESRARDFDVTDDVPF